MQAGIDAQKVGDVVLFDTAKEPVFVEGRVHYGYTRHVCQATVRPKQFQPLKEKPKPQVFCQRCQQYVSPAEADFSASDPGWVCHKCKRLGGRIDLRA